MRNFCFLFSLLLVLGCKKQILPSDISKLNGYWQIEKVVLPDGHEKDYTFAGSYDYFEISGSAGFRRKAMPQFNGTFEANDVAEKVSAIFESGRAYLKYSTAYSKWREELTAISDSAFTVVNAENKTYQYKRAEPINISGNGKAAQ